MSSSRLVKLMCNGRRLYLSTTVEKDGSFALLLTDTNKSWTGNVSNEDLSIDNKERNIEDHAELSRKALSGDDITPFEFELKDETQKSLRLVWKRVVEPDHIKFQLGSIIMQQTADAGAAIASIFDQLINSTSDLRQQITHLKSEQARLSSERKEALKELEGCTNIKEDTEQDLYAKFVVVLNSKKAKIRQLKAELEAVQSESGAVTKPPATTSSHDTTAAKQRSARTHHNSSDNFSCSTDDEDEDTKTKSSGAVCTVTNSKVASDDKKKRDSATATAAAADASSELMLEDSVADDDGEIPAGPKRATNRKRPTDDHDPSSKPSLWKPGVPMMLSMTGTTNTSTTSSDMQRWRQKSDTKKDKESGSSSPKHSSNSISRSAEIDDLIGDMD